MKCDSATMNCQTNRHSSSKYAVSTFVLDVNEERFRASKKVAMLRHSVEEGRLAVFFYRAILALSTESL